MSFQVSQTRHSRITVPSGRVLVRFLWGALQGAVPGFLRLFRFSVAIILPLSPIQNPKLGYALHPPLPLLLPLPSWLG